MKEVRMTQQDVITELISESNKIKRELRLERELEETQMRLINAITELDLTRVEIVKWEKDFMDLVNDFKALVKCAYKQ